MGSLQYVLERGQDEDWFNDIWITSFTVTAVFGFFLFIWRELTFRNPIVDLRVLIKRQPAYRHHYVVYPGFWVVWIYLYYSAIYSGNFGWTAQQSGMLMVPAALTTAFMMPIIGQLLQKGVKQQYLVSIGMFVFFVYSFWGYKILTPDTGKDAFFWMLIVRGMGLGLLFIPITTLALSTLKGKEIGQGASFTGMMRQLGGSFGVASITTFMARRHELYRSNLVSKLDTNSPLVQDRVHGMQQGFIAKGSSPEVALKQAYMALEGMVYKQASVLSYMDVFLYLGILFLLCIPFILFVKEKKGGQKIDISEAMH